SSEYVSDTSLQLLLDAKRGLRHPLQKKGQHYVLLEATTASPVLNLEEAVTTLLGELLEQAELRTMSSAVVVELRVGSSYRLREELISRQIDIAFFIRPLTDGSAEPPPVRLPHGVCC